MTHEELLSKLRDLAHELEQAEVFADVDPARGAYQFAAGRVRELLKAAKETPDLDLHDQVEAKRKHNCPDCETETDTTRDNGPNGDEFTEYCTNDDCEWEMKLGTVTESLS